MIRRSLGAALWTLVGLLAGFLGALSSLVGTGAGRALLARVSEGALHQVFTGTMEIGDVHGSLLTGLTLSRVRLFDADTTLVAWLPEVNVSYNPFDFAAGRVVLFEFDLRQPVINIVQHPNGRLNIEELLRLGGPDKGPHGPAALILFRNVRITDGTVTLRLQAKRPEPGDSSLEFASDDPNGRLRVRRVEVLEATDAQPPVGVVARELEARVARLGPLRLQSQGHRPVRDADVPEQDEGGRPVRALVGTPEAQQLFDVEPAIRVLHDVDHRLTQVEFEEHDPAGREVERVVAHIDFW